LIFARALIVFDLLSWVAVALLALRLEVAITSLAATTSSYNITSQCRVPSQRTFVSTFEATCV